MKIAKRIIVELNSSGRGKLEIQNFFEINWQSTDDTIVWDAFKAYIRGVFNIGPEFIKNNWRKKN